MIVLSSELLHLFFIHILFINVRLVVSGTSETHNHMLDSEDKELRSKFSVNNATSDLNHSVAIARIQPLVQFNITQIAKNLNDFGIHSFKDDLHIKGLQLNWQGKLNPNFHKEIFLGNHELSEVDIQHDKKKLHKKIEEIFNEADSNHDERLSRDEITDHVLRNIQQHLKEARDKNLQLFLFIDSNEDGKVTWAEYNTLYIKFHNMNVSKTLLLNNPDHIMDVSDPDLKKELSKIRYRWVQADNDNNNELNADEFLEFRHPEVFGRSFKYIVEDMMALMDRNGDKQIDQNEFSFIPPSMIQGENNPWDSLNKRLVQEKVREFHEMDQDQNGFLTKEELLQAFNPMNRVHIDLQIKRLFPLVDDSPKDDALSLEEMKKHADVFTRTNILETEKVLHEDV